MSNVVELLEQLLAEAEPIFKVTTDILDPKMYLQISTPPGYGDFHKATTGIETFRQATPTLLGTRYTSHIIVSPKTSTSAQLKFQSSVGIPHASKDYSGKDWSIHLEAGLADSVIADLIDKFHGKEQFELDGENISVGTSAFLNFAFTKTLLIQHGGTPLDIQKAIYSVEHEFQGLLKDLIVEAQKLLADNTSIETAAELSAEKAGLLFIQMTTILADLAEKVKVLTEIKVPEDPKEFFKALLAGDAHVVKALQALGNLSWLEELASHVSTVAEEFHNDLNIMHEKLKKLGAD